ncbi:hypothetical protein SAMN02910317_01167 [Ruminococcaceae bacterium FB2012]|nr:hypothetical protein SAMN02910317_01167 [Ruminococcaceae bacterium FB2012]
MISAEKKKALAAMIQECIGSRTLEQVFKDTGISCAKLHRLRNAKFAKIPDRDFFAALTDPKSHPQNGITLEDFENLINNELFSEIAESKTDAMAAKALGLLASYFIDTSLTSAAKADDTKRYDYLFIKDGKRMAVDFKLVAHKSASLASVRDFYSLINVLSSIIILALLCLSPRNSL